MTVAKGSDVDRALGTVQEWIGKANRVMVACHRRPDGDALGSAIGLASGLTSMGLDVTLYCPDELPGSLEYLGESWPLVRELEPGAVFPLTLVMDTAARSLLPEPFPEPAVTGKLAIFDHHAVGEDFGDLMVRDAEACATGVLVVDLLRRLGVDPLPSVAARALYCSICADTGGFRYANTDPTTLRLAADLLEQGADPWEAAYNLFEGWSQAHVNLLTSVLSGMTIELDGRLAVLRVSQSALDAAGARPEMVDGLVNYGRAIRGVEVAALLWERPERDSVPQTKLSFRSQGSTDVSLIARGFGGGGHRLAAACLVESSIEELAPQVIEQARAALAEQ